MTRRSFRVMVLVWVVGLTVVLTGPIRADTKAEEHAVYVILWFDTEDYLLPADDDAALRLSEFLTKEGIRCTHKIVGEKARVLEKRGRADVIDAIKKHEVGYHSDFHSVQPTPAQFMSTQGWDDGVAEFDRRQRQGLLDVERITGQKPSCYGQPGSSWGPQQFGAMRQWGTPVYLDAGSHVNLDGDPFWYCGILNLYALKATLRTNLGGPQDLEEAKKRFDKAYEELLAEGGGPVSIYYHPCEFVHKQFWDGVNFSKGANPPRSEWKVPPQKTPEESRVAFETFEGYIRFIKSHPKVQFVTAREALDLYRDRAQGREFPRAEIAKIASQVRLQNGANSIPRKRTASSVGRAPASEVAEDEVGFQKHDGFTLSTAEVFYLLVENALAGRGADTRIVLDRSPLGPTQPAPQHQVVDCDRSQMERTIEDVADYMKRHGRVPNAVWIGSSPVSPESFLRTLPIFSSEVTEFRFTPTSLHSSRYVADDDPKLWGWVIFPPSFKAPEMMQLAKRQAWTLKPAVLSDGPGAAN